MPGDRSLDEFVTGSDAAAEDEPVVAVESSADAASVVDEPELAESIDDDPTIEPAAETVDWSLDGRPCASCGEPATRRWRDGDRLVCEECKDW